MAQILRYGIKNSALETSHVPHRLLISVNEVEKDGIILQLYPFHPTFGSYLLNKHRISCEVAHPYSIERTYSIGHPAHDLPDLPVGNLTVFFKTSLPRMQTYHHIHIFLDNASAAYNSFTRWICNFVKAIIPTLSHLDNKGP
jgi:hypothetical protein